MSKKRELETLLGNIQRGLKKYSVQDLNEAIVTFLNKKNDKSIEIEKVISIVSKEYNVSRNTLKNKNARGTLQEAKQISYCLLHFNLGLSIRYIANSIFFCWPTSVAIGIKKYKEADKNHKEDIKFIEKYEKLQGVLIKEICN
jgi:chromosomal replication initiation ATPase DnaA